MVTSTVKSLVWNACFRRSIASVNRCIGQGHPVARPGFNQIMQPEQSQNKPVNFDKCPKNIDELPDDPLVRHFDYANLRSKEVLIFMEESKIWQDLLSDCISRSGVNSNLTCRQLQDIVHERNRYYDSKFDPSLRPKSSAGIPPEMESRYQAK
jgi:hypothetical protein